MSFSRKNLKKVDKRPSTNITEEIISEARRQAVAYEIQRITAAAVRGMRHPTLAPKFKFCNDERPTKSCDNHGPNEKRQLVIKNNLCFICLSTHNHHPAKCRTLRHQDELQLKSFFYISYGVIFRYLQARCVYFVDINDDIGGAGPGNNILVPQEYIRILPEDD